MMKYGMKTILAISILMSICLSVTTYATDNKVSGAAIQFGTAAPTSSDGTKDTIKSSSPKEADQAIQERATPILNAYIWFGYAISLGMVVFIGIKYMLGAADARASMKSAMVGWLIGALVVFMATTIAGWVINIAIPDKDGSADGLANEIVQNGWDLGN